MKKIRCIQNFIHNMDPELIPMAKLKRLKRGYSNKRIIEDFKSMMIDAEIEWKGNRPFFIVPYCNLAMQIGLGHGLGLYEVKYPKDGYFANQDNTLDKAYDEIGGHKS